MSFEWQGKPVSSRRFVSYAPVRLGAITSALFKRPTRVWLIGTIVLVITVGAFLTMPPAPTVNAAPESDTPLDCISCHPRTLKFHDKLGSGNEACWVCHDNTDMKMLRLANGTPLPLADSPQLCAQCHQERYDAWKEGTHGIPGPSTEKCADCHNPHQPQIALLNITKPHPPPAPSSPSPSTDLLVILGISLLATVAIGIVVAMRGERP